MSLSADQLLDRILAIEEAIADLETTITNLATRTQLNNLLNLRQGEIEDLKTRMTVLESAVALLG